MRINTNIAAINTQRVCSINDNLTQKALEKLSSGRRINSAADDAAGLSISEKMRGQIRGLSQAIRNAQDAVSLIQTAEGGASSIHDMLQRTRELAVQASNGTLNSDDRNKIQDEVDEIIKQIDKVANETEFNTMKLLNINGASQFPGISQSALNQLTSILPNWINDGLVAINNQINIAYPDSPVNRPMNVEYYYDATPNVAWASMGTSDGGATLNLRINVAKFFDTSGNLQSEGTLDRVVAHEIVHALEFTETSFSSTPTWFLEGLAMTIQGGNDFGVTDHNVAAGWDGDYRSAFEAVKTLHEITNGGISAIIDRLELGDTLDAAFANTTQVAQGELAIDGTISDFNSAGSFITWFNTHGAELSNYLDTSTDFSQGTGAIVTGSTSGSGSNLTTDQTITNGTGTTQVNTYFTLNLPQSSSGSKFIFLVGPNSGQTIGVQGCDLRLSALGLTNLDLKSTDAASSAIGMIDAAIQIVSASRSYLGAIQNRLEHTIANQINVEENLTASESRIRDVDMAKEMTSFSKNNVLSQAARAMLAQANQQPQNVLHLLRAG